MGRRDRSGRSRSAPGAWVVQERIAVRREVFPVCDGDGTGRRCATCWSTSRRICSAAAGRLPDAAQRDRARQRDVGRRPGAGVRRVGPLGVVPYQRISPHKTCVSPAETSARRVILRREADVRAAVHQRRTDGQDREEDQDQREGCREEDRDQGRQEGCAESREEDRAQAERGVHEAGHAERRIWRRSSAPSRFRAPRSPRSSGPTSRRTACRTPRTSA